MKECLENRILLLSEAKLKRMLVKKIDNVISFEVVEYHGELSETQIENLVAQVYAEDGKLYLLLTTEGAEPTEIETRKGSELLALFLAL